MTAITVRQEPEICAPPTRGEQDFGLSASFEGDLCVVSVTGELDLHTRARLFFACTARHRLPIVVDLSAVRFMDCGGYGGIVAARNVVEADGRTLTLRNARGATARLLDVVADLERRPPTGFCPAAHVDGAESLAPPIASDVAA